MRNNFLIFTLMMSLILSASGSSATTLSRTQSVMRQDLTERLENIDELRGSLRSLKLQISTLEIALTEARKIKSRKKIYKNTKTAADALTAITILSGAMASYYFENKLNIFKIASLIGGVSTSVSVIAGLAAEFSTDEAEIILAKIADIKPILKATESNLSKEVKLLCSQEPSNQMCQ